MTLYEITRIKAKVTSMLPILWPVSFKQKTGLSDIKLRIGGYITAKMKALNTLHFRKGFDCALLAIFCIILML